MKKRKHIQKILLILMATLAAIFLVSCGGTEDATGNLSMKPTDDEYSGDRDLPELKIGCTLVAPYFYVGEDGSYAGIDAEIAEEACRRLGYEPKFTVITWGEQESQINEGNVDCIWSCFAMDGREQIYQWAGPYLYSQEVVVVPADSDIENMSDLAGKKVDVRVASRAEDYFMKAATPNVPAVSQVITYENKDDAFTAFGKGYADAIAEHKLVLNEMTKDHPELYRYLEPSFMSVKLGVAFSKSYDTEIVQKLNDTLLEMNQDGTIPEIAAKYGVEDTDLTGAAGNAK